MWALSRTPHPSDVKPCFTSSTCLSVAHNSACYIMCPAHEIQWQQPQLNAWPGVSAICTIVLGCYRDGGYLISFFGHISRSSSLAIKLVCLYEKERQPNVWKFNFSLPTTQLTSPSGILLAIMSTMIIYRIRLNKEKSILTLLLHQNFKTIFSGF